MLGSGVAVWLLLETARPSRGLRAPGRRTGLWAGLLSRPLRSPGLRRVLTAGHASAQKGVVPDPPPGPGAPWGLEILHARGPRRVLVVLGVVAHLYPEYEDMGASFRDFVNTEALSAISPPPGSKIITNTH